MRPRAALSLLRRRPSDARAYLKVIPLAFEA